MDTCPKKDKSKPVKCIVILDNNKLTLKFDYNYNDGNGLIHVSYIGEELGSGHWHLEGTDGYAATLHQLTPESVFLEGYWQSGADQGFWRIHLSDDNSSGN